MLDVTFIGWVATLGVIAGLLTLDWLLMGRRSHAIELGEAARWSLWAITECCGWA